MSMSPDQAADSLKEIERTSRRSAQAFSYASASPYFLIWGVIWMIGYAGSDLLPHQDGLWTALTVVGVAACMIVGRRQNRHSDVARARANGYRFLASFAVIFCFVFALFLVLGPPRNPAVAGAIAPLLVAMFYALLGVWKGIRFLVTGMAVAALTLGGFFWLPQHFL